MRLNSFTLLFLAAFASGVNGAVAQEKGKLYRVELLVFERQYRNDSPLDEKWPSNISLSYPEETVTLDNDSRDTGDNADAGTSAPSSSTIQRLPKSELKLTRQRDALERDNRLRTLFHGAWEQPLVSPAKAPAIVIRGGNGYGEHYELEGIIKVSVSRYVHLDTDLWFSEFVPNHGQQPEYWLALPPLPGTGEDAVRTEGGLIATTTPETGDSGQAALPPTAVGEFDDTPAFPIEEAYEDPLETFLRSPYFIENIVTFRQSRRMRSNELHYLDHPRLGMLVRVEPVKSGE